jgi:hypothetical protein
MIPRAGSRNREVFDKKVGASSDHWIVDESSGPLRRRFLTVLGGLYACCVDSSSASSRAEVEHPQLILASPSGCG